VVRWYLMGTLQDHEMLRAIQLNGRRVTIRLPAMFADQMEVRARGFGRSLNVEYGQAVEAWCGGGFGWVALLLSASDIHASVTAEVVKGQQWAPAVVEALEMPAGKYIGLSLAGYMITLDRAWFVSDEAFERTRAILANNLPLVAEPEGESSVVVYGRPIGTAHRKELPPTGTLCKKIGCKAPATEYLSLAHIGTDKTTSGFAVPVCGAHAMETRNRIRQGITSFVVE